MPRNTRNDKFLAFIDDSRTSNIMKTTGKPKKTGKTTGPSHGRWTKEEHEAFLEGLKKHGREWKKVAEMIKTRTSAQIRSHAQKYFFKMGKKLNNLNAINKGNEESKVSTSRTQSSSDGPTKGNKKKRAGKKRSSSISSTSAIKKRKKKNSEKLKKKSAGKSNSSKKPTRKPEYEMSYNFEDTAEEEEAMYQDNMHDGDDFIGKNGVHYEESAKGYHELTSRRSRRSSFRNHGNTGKRRPQMSLNLTNLNLNAMVRGFDDTTPGSIVSQRSNTAHVPPVSLGPNLCTQFQQQHLPQAPMYWHAVYDPQQNAVHYHRKPILNISNTTPHHPPMIGQQQSQQKPNSTKQTQQQVSDSNPNEVAQFALYQNPIPSLPVAALRQVQQYTTVNASVNMCNGHLPSVTNNGRVTHAPTVTLMPNDNPALSSGKGTGKCCTTVGKLSQNKSPTPHHADLPLCSPRSMEKLKRLDIDELEAVRVLSSTQRFLSALPIHKLLQQQVRKVTKKKTKTITTTDPLSVTAPPQYPHETPAGPLLNSYRQLSFNNKSEPTVLAELKDIHKRSAQTFHM